MPLNFNPLGLVDQIEVRLVAGFFVQGKSSGLVHEPNASASQISRIHDLKTRTISNAHVRPVPYARPSLITVTRLATAFALLLGGVTSARASISPLEGSQKALDYVATVASALDPSFLQAALGKLKNGEAVVFLTDLPFPTSSMRTDALLAAARNEPTIAFQIPSSR